MVLNWAYFVSYQVLPAIPRDKAGPEAYRVLSEERLRDAVRRKAEPAELERLITEVEGV